MTDASGPVPVIAGLSSIADRYDVILCDIWGVLHDGIRAFPETGEALSRFRAQGGTVVLVSNAPRPGSDVLPLLDQLGARRDAYDDIVTSGDVTRRSITARPGEPLFHLGPERDEPLFGGLDCRRVPLEEARYVVLTGLFDDDHETPEDYHDRLEAMRARKLPMICANPDLVVERGHRLVYCAGALAALYEARGGEVTYAGKPHRPIYEAALARAAAARQRPVDEARTLAIGDAIRTDITGARGVGLDALFVTRGIHAREFADAHGAHDEMALAQWITEQSVHPTMMMEMLTW
ncbi:TIGR01459 family HAD-type hydrolase [Chelatococcus sp. GCM10030263]|uniref:TIGR01459 family HAD-type hydrolase n=1 Tax=Chelatococcus sp. GCM10030263 TaxID=3273387 RepID=UPI00361350BF